MIFFHFNSVFLQDSYCSLTWQRDIMDFVCQSTIEFGHEIIPKLYLSIASKPLKYLHDALWYVPSVTQLVQSGTEVPTYNAAIFTY